MDRESLGGEKLCQPERAVGVKDIVWHSDVDVDPAVVRASEKEAVWKESKQRSMRGPHIRALDGVVRVDVDDHVGQGRDAEGGKPSVVCDMGSNVGERGRSSRRSAPLAIHGPPREAAGGTVDKLPQELFGTFVVGQLQRVVFRWAEHPPAGVDANIGRFSNREYGNAGPGQEKPTRVHKAGKAREARRSVPDEDDEFWSPSDRLIVKALGTRRRFVRAAFARWPAAEKNIDVNISKGQAPSPTHFVGHLCR